jgi:hypothetical protein
MTQQIAQKLVNFIIAGGPSPYPFDKYKQELIDQVDDFLFLPDVNPCPVNLTLEEHAFARVHTDQISDAYCELL